MTRNLSRSDLLAIVCLLAILVGFVAWQYLPAQEYEWKYDEGVDIAKATLLLDGYDLYHDIWSDHAPAFTFFMAGAFAIFGETAFVGRMLVLVFSLVGLISLYALSRHLAGPWVALGAVVMMMAQPHLQLLSRQVLIGWPAIAVAIMAMAWGAAYAKHQRDVLLVLAGLSFACSLLIKPITVPLFPALVWFAWQSQTPPKLRIPWRALIVLGTSMLAPALVALAYGRLPFLQQVIGVLFLVREEQTLASNMTDIIQYIVLDKYGVSHLGLLSLAMVGLASLALKRNWTFLGAILLWLVLAILALMWHTPLRRHEIILMMPSLAMAAVAAIQHTVDVIGTWRDSVKPQKTLAILGVLAMTAWLAGLPGIYRSSIDLRLESVLPRDKEAMHQEAVQFLRKETPEGSVLISDEPMFALLSERLVPPEIAVTSYRRIQAGALGPELVDLTLQKEPGAVIVWRGVFQRIPGFVEWVRSTYALGLAHEPGQEIYLPVPSEPQFVPQSATWPAGISLTGSMLQKPGAEPGQAIDLRIYCHADQAMSDDYTLFVHLIDPDGTRIAGIDLRPLDNTFLTSDWEPGMTVCQHVSLAVPNEVTPGHKLLSVGWYDAEGSRLDVMDDAKEPMNSNQVVLGTQPVVLWPAVTTAPSVQNQCRADFGEQARLLGFDVATAAPSTSELELALYWQCLAPMDQDYTVFVHLVDAQGKIVGQKDQQPGEGNLPTSVWRPGEFLEDHYKVALSDDLEPGTYSLRIGLYDLDTGARLNVDDSTDIARGDHIILSDAVTLGP